jgi:hypothetical protein
MGFGKLVNAGAVYVNTFDPFVLEVTHVPMLPPFTVWPEVHVAAFVAVGFGTAVVGSGVYTYEHVHVTVSVVVPPTAAVNENACPATTVARPGLTVTVITFAPELPQLAIHNMAQIAANIVAPCMIRTFITDISPIPFRGIPLLNFDASTSCLRFPHPSPGTDPLQTPRHFIRRKIAFPVFLLPS